MLIRWGVSRSVDVLNYTALLVPVMLRLSVYLFFLKATNSTNATRNNRRPFGDSIKC